MPHRRQPGGAPPLAHACAELLPRLDVWPVGLWGAALLPWRHVITNLVDANNYNAYSRHLGHVLGYIRVSTDGQAASGLGLEAQQAAITSAAARLGIPVAQWFTDAAVSGAASLEARPGLMAAVQALRRWDVLICAKRDRLGRDVLNVAMLVRLVQRKGGRIVSAADEGTDGNSPADALMRTMLDAFAEFERALIATRTKAALKAKRARGYRAGNVPFGFVAAPDGQLHANAEEQQVIGLIATLRSTGLSLRAIAAELNRQGYTTRRWTPWRHEYVAGLQRAA